MLPGSILHHKSRDCLEGSYFYLRVTQWSSHCGAVERSWFSLGFLRFCKTGSTPPPLGWVFIYISVHLARSRSFNGNLELWFTPPIKSCGEETLFKKTHSPEMGSPTTPLNWPKIKTDCFLLAPGYLLSFTIFCFTLVLLDYTRDTPLKKNQGNNGIYCNSLLRMLITFLHIFLMKKHWEIFLSSQNPVLIIILYHNWLFPPSGHYWIHTMYSHCWSFFPICTQY